MTENKTEVDLDDLEKAIKFNTEQFQEFYDRKSGQPMPENLKYVALIYEAARAYLSEKRSEPTGDKSAALPTKDEWTLAGEEELKRDLKSALDFKWYHVLYAHNNLFPFSEINGETWGAMPVGVIESLRVFATRYASLQENTAPDDIVKALDILKPYAPFLRISDEERTF